MKHIAFSFVLTAALFLLSLTGFAQGFRNPVLPVFHADPSVCRAGEDFQF